MEIAGELQGHFDVEADQRAAGVDEHVREAVFEIADTNRSAAPDAVEQRPGFAISESPTYVARGVAALAGDPDAGRWSGTILSARQLADAYGVTDIDGSKPDCWGHLAAFGWEHSGGEGIENFR